MHSDYPRLLHTTAREKSNYMQIERSVLQLIYMGQLLARISRRTITKHRDYNPQSDDRDTRPLDAVRDWRFSEAVGIGLLAGWFYDVREERRPGIDPQKSVTGFRFGGRGRGRPENIKKKNRFNFRDFSDVFKFFKFSGP